MIGILIIYFTILRGKSIAIFMAGRKAEDHTAEEIFSTKMLSSE